MSGALSRSRLINTPQKGETLEQRILQEIVVVKPRAIALAVAYVSVYGANFVRQIVTRTSAAEVRLVADVRDAISHPAAFAIGSQQGWRIRTVNSKRVTFHSKFMVCGDGFTADGEVKAPRWMIVGSGNLSKGGLCANFETSLIRATDLPNRRAGAAYRELWGLGSDLTPASLAEYEVYCKHAA